MVKYYYALNKLFICFTSNCPFYGFNAIVLKMWNLENADMKFFVFISYSWCVQLNESSNTVTSTENMHIQRKCAYMHSNMRRWLYSVHVHDGLPHLPASHPGVQLWPECSWPSMVPEHCHSMYPRYCMMMGNVPSSYWLRDNTYATVKCKVEFIRTVWI